MSRVIVVDRDVICGRYEEDTSAQMSVPKRLQQTQARVDQVVGIMQTNVDRVLERDAKLSELDDRAGELMEGLRNISQRNGVGWVQRATMTH